MANSVQHQLEFFKVYDNKLSELLVSQNNILNKSFLNYVDNLKSLLVTFLLLWIIYNAIQIMYGKNNRNVKDFFWESFIKCIVITFCLNSGGWLSYVNDIFNGIKNIDISLGVFSLMGQLDIWLNRFWSTILWASSGTSVFSPFSSLATFFYIIFLCLIFFFGCYKLVKTYAINLFLGMVLMAIAPLMFLMLLVPVLKNTFSEYLKLLVSNILTIVILTIVIFSITRLVSYFYVNGSDLAADEISSIFQSLFYFILGSIVLETFASIAINLAESLSGANLESAVSQSSTNSLAKYGALAGAGAGMAKVAGMVTGKTASNIFGAGAGMAGRAFMQSKMGQSLTTKFNKLSNLRKGK